MRYGVVGLAAGILFQMQVRLAPEPIFFRFVRPVTVDSGAGTIACAVLDRTLYAHAQPALADVRLMARTISGLREVPYALTISETGSTIDTARVLNRNLRGTRLDFDLEMPKRPYSEVRLNLGVKDFSADAKVTGFHKLGDPNGIYLGTFTLFDLSGKGLSRNTTLPLAETTYPYLHVELSMKGAAGPLVSMEASLVTGAEVPASRGAQTLYTRLWTTTEIAQHGQSSVAEFYVEPHVPIERVSVELAAGDTTNFYRTVHVRARASGSAKATEEVYSGQIARLHLEEEGKEIRDEKLSVPAIVGSNAQSAAEVEVAVDNGKDWPLPLRAVRLEMRERRLCFDVPNESMALYYGDPKRRSPAYDYASLFNATAPAHRATLGPEVRNPAFKQRADDMRKPEGHRTILWITLIGVISVLFVTLYRSRKDT